MERARFLRHSALRNVVIIVRHALLFCHAQVAVPHPEQEQTAIIISSGGDQQSCCFLPLLQVVQAPGGEKRVLLVVEASSNHLCRDEGHVVLR